MQISRWQTPSVYGQSLNVPWQITMTFSRWTRHCDGARYFAFASDAEFRASNSDEFLPPRRVRSVSVSIKSLSWNQSVFTPFRKRREDETRGFELIMELRVPGGSSFLWKLISVSELISCYQSRFVFVYTTVYKYLDNWSKIQILFFRGLWWKNVSLSFLFRRYNWAQIICQIDTEGKNTFVSFKLYVWICNKQLTL